MTFQESKDLRVLQEELSGNKDAIHNFEAQHSERYWDASHVRPVLDEKLLEREPSIAAALRWPEGRRFAALLSHDVDGTREHSREQLARLIGMNLSAAPTALEMVRSRVRERPGYLLVERLAAPLGEPRAQQPDCRARACEALEPRRRQHAQLDLAHARA